VLHEGRSDTSRVGSFDQLLGEAAAVGGHALQVLARAVVARLGELGQGEQRDVAGLADLDGLLEHHALEVDLVLLVLDDEPGAFQGALDRVEEIVGIERLDDVVVGPFAQALAHGFQGLEAGHHDDLDVGVELLEALEQLDAGEPGHLDVGQHEGGPGHLGGQSHGLDRIARLQDFIGEAREMGPQEPANTRLVVDDDDPFSHGISEMSWASVPRAGFGMGFRHADLTAKTPAGPGLRRFPARDYLHHNN
jgi:hypothetical protein